MAGATQLAGAKSGGADVRACEKGDGAVTAAGRGGNGKQDSHGNKAGRGIRSWQPAHPDGTWVISNTPVACPWVPSPLEPVWGSTHPKSPQIASSCPRAALTFHLPCPTDVRC